MKINWPAFRFGCLLMAGAAMAAMPAMAQVSRGAATAAPAPSSSISSVEVVRAGEQTMVHIGGTGELHYRTSRMDNPPRLVLDFPDTRVAVPQNTVSSEYGPVREVRIGQAAPGQSRVVIDLAAFSPYSVEASDSNLKISFSASAGGQVQAAFEPARKIKQKNAVAMKVPDMPLPAWITGQAMAFASPASEPASPAPQNQTLQASAALPQATSGPTNQRYTGDPISVNLKDVDLKDFFRLIHEISGLNVVLDPTVKGTVTLVLDEVPWDQALDIVLSNNGLSKQIDGNVLRIVTQDTLKREAVAQLDLAKAQSAATPTVTVTRVLSYAKAVTLVPTLKPLMSPRGTIFADARSNTLIISDVPDLQPKLDNLIRQLDRKSQQVEIDARVVSATRSFARDIGTQFGFSTTAGNTGLGGLVGNSAFTSPISHGGITPPFSIPTTTLGASGNSIPLNSNLGATAPNSGITFSTQGANYAIDFILSAMETKGVGKVLSEPKGITQNNEKLTVKQGTEIPIQTTINNTISVQFVDAVLKLEVTPQITSEGTVFLDITVENTSIDNGIPLVNGIPALETQSAETKVLINDGGTVVIGGVVLNSQQTTINQVPLLGSVPLIGQLFKHTTVNVSSQELLFFVTPRILPS